MTPGRRNRVRAQRGPSHEDDRVGKKIAYLREEGVPRDQAIATAISMGRAGRLTRSGGYVRARRKR